MFYLRLWFTSEVWLFHAFWYTPFSAISFIFSGSLRWYDYSSHSVHSTPLIYLSVRFTRRHKFYRIQRFAHNYCFILLILGSLKHHDWIIVGQVHSCGIVFFTWLGSLLWIGLFTFLGSLIKIVLFFSCGSLVGYHVVIFSTGTFVTALDWFIIHDSLGFSRHYHISGFTWLTLINIRSGFTFNLMLIS